MPFLFVFNAKKWEVYPVEQTKYLCCPECGCIYFTEFAVQHTVQHRVRIQVDGEVDYAEATLNELGEIEEITGYECEKCDAVFVLVGGRLCNKETIFEDPIPAAAYTDDQVFNVNFLANPWFEVALEDEIAGLARNGWGPCYESEDIAVFISNINSDVSDMFNYLEIKNKHLEGKEGFGCIVNRGAALKWLKKHRPEVYRKLQEEGLTDDTDIA